MADFAAMNDKYSAYFGDTKPARSTVAVKELPKTASFEIRGVGLGEKAMSMTPSIIQGGILIFVALGLIIFIFIKLSKAESSGGHSASVGKEDNK